MADDLRAALRERAAEAVWDAHEEWVVLNGGCSTSWTTAKESLAFEQSVAATRRSADAVLALLDDWVPRADRLREAIRSAERAILGDGTNESDQRLHEALTPLWGAATESDIPQETVTALQRKVEAERDAARADLVALLEGMEQVGWRKVHQTDDGPVDDLCPMSKYRTDYPGAGYAPVYRLSPSAASLHAGLTGAVTGPSAPAAPIETGEGKG